MAAPIIKMYATDKIPQFEAFVSTEKYPHANELWREEFDVGYTKGEGWSGGKKKPTPFVFFGRGERDVVQRSRRLLLGRW